MKEDLHIKILNYAFDNPKYEWVSIFAKPALIAYHPILFIKEWVKYSKRFFFIAPKNRWHDYFGSHWRVVIACVYSDLELREAKEKDGMWGFQDRRNQLTEKVKQGNGLI